MAVQNKPVLLMCMLLAYPAVSMPASDADPCTTAFDAEQARIERDFSARPPGPDRDAQVQWSKALHAAMEGAASRARKCQEDGRPKPGSATFQKGLEREQQCSAKANAQLAELDQRYAGHTRSAAEQRTIRDAQARITDERMQCARSASR